MAKDTSYTLDDLRIDNDLGGSNSSRGSAYFAKKGVLPDTVVTSAKDPETDPLAALKLVNVGTGAGVFQKREDNTFMFRSLKAGGGMVLTISDTEILLTSDGSAGPSDPVTFFTLPDVPDPTGNGGKVLALNSGATALEWVDQATGGGGGAEAFSDLTDVPADYTGAAGKLVAVKSTEDGLEYVDAPTGGGGSGNTTRYDATISFGPTGLPAVTDLPAGWSFAPDIDVPSKITITHTVGHPPAGVSILAYQGTVATLTPLGTGTYKIQMDQATVNSVFTINFASLSVIGGSVDSTGKLYFVF
jgi:hypothetical protein